MVRALAPRGAICGHMAALATVLHHPALHNSAWGAQHIGRSGW